MHDLVEQLVRMERETKGMAVDPDEGFGVLSLGDDVAVRFVTVEVKEDENGAYVGVGFTRGADVPGRLADELKAAHFADVREAMEFVIALADSINDFYKRIYDSIGKRFHGKGAPSTLQD